MEQVGQSIEVFRRQRGLLDGSLHGAHCCGDGECRGFTHLGGDVWICANTGGSGGTVCGALGILLLEGAVWRGLI